MKRWSPAKAPSRRSRTLPGAWAELLLDFVGVGGAALPVNFHSPPHECSVAAPFWGSIPELIDVIALAQSGKIGILVEHFPLSEAGRAYDLLHHGKIKGRAVITPND
jgi:propanol-preferring alcohol dehydrogenase